MGGHRKKGRPKSSGSRRSMVRSASPNVPASFPSLPDNVGRKTKWKSIRGELRTVTIVDEIRRVQSSNPHKVICLQQIRFDHSDEIEYRLGYYMIGVKPRMAGRWTWGQFAILIPAKDFRWIVRRAEKRGWI
jgi:hypothetical protein